jgi:UDP-glucose:(glucosyl)LPS alpha-1,2-glucosyltransferase
MVKNFREKILPYLPKFKNYDCYVLPGQLPSISEIKNSKKEIIVWMHNTYYQFDPSLMHSFFSNDILNKIKYIVVVSEFLKQETLKFLPIDKSKVIVIPNAIKPLKYDFKKFKNPKLIKVIHTSTFERGTPLLVKALEKIDENFRLEIYNDFYPHFYPDYVPDSRIRFYGKTPKDTVIEAVESSHIHAYPSVFPETFCLSQVEAMSAGLLCVTSDLGALSEVSNNLTLMYPYEKNDIKHSDIFAEHLTKAIQNIKNNNWNPEKQIQYVNSEYSWDRHKEHWLELHKSL